MLQRKMLLTTKIYMNFCLCNVDILKNILTVKWERLFYLRKKGLRNKKKVKRITFMVTPVHPHIKTASRNNSKIPLPAAYES